MGPGCRERARRRLARAWDPAAGSERGGGWPEHAATSMGPELAPRGAWRPGAVSPRRLSGSGPAEQRVSLPGSCGALGRRGKARALWPRARQRASMGKRPRQGGSRPRPAFVRCQASMDLDNKNTVALPVQSCLAAAVLGGGGPGDRLMGLRWATGSQYRLASHGPTRFPACPGCPAASGAVSPACKCGCRAPRRCRSRALASSGHSRKDGWRRTIRCTGIASAREESSTRRSRSLRARCCSRCHCSR